MSTLTHQLCCRPLRHLPALLGAALLAVLIPLACILDCQLHSSRRVADHSQHSRAAHRHDLDAADTPDAGGYTPAGHDHRLCGMHAADPVLAYPYALYELVPLAASLLSVVFLVLGATSPLLRLRATHAAYLPLTPPPQLAAR